MADKKVEEWIEQRKNVPGRREGDVHQCVMHDYAFAKNDECFRIVKDSIKTEAAKTEHKFEVFDERLNNYLTKWATTMLIGIGSSICAGIAGLAIWYLSIIGDDIRYLSSQMTTMSEVSITSMSELKSQNVRIGVKQEGILRELERMGPEHKLLMEHLRQSQ